jgi:uncharacterized protein Yka (UPF0111/DUF47 family)
MKTKIDNLKKRIDNLAKEFRLELPEPKTVIHKSKVMGVEYHTTKIGASIYLKIIHKPSGMAIFSFHNNPVKNVREIMKKADQILALINWDVPEKEFTPGHRDNYLKLRKEIDSNSEI